MNINLIIFLSAFGSILAGSSAMFTLFYTMYKNKRIEFGYKDCANYRTNNDRRIKILERRFEADHKTIKCQKAALIFLVVKAGGSPDELGLIDN